MNQYATVCVECLTAACWLGEFMCDKSQRADLTVISRAEFLALGREHADYFDHPHVSASEHQFNQRGSSIKNRVSAG